MGVSNRYRADFGGIAGIRMVPVLGRHKVVSELWFIDTPLVRSACRITLPTDVVVSSVKNYFLKIRWIDLSSSAFFSLPIFFLILPCEFWSSLLSEFFRVIGFHVGWTIFAFNLVGSISEEF